MSKTHRKNSITQYRGFDIYKTSEGYSWDGGGPFEHLTSVKCDIDNNIDNGTKFQPHHRVRVSRRRFDDVEYASW